MKTLGTIRRADCVEAELVLASGVYLTFRIDTSKTSIQSLIEVRRYRLHMRPRESVLVDAHALQLARRAALDAILAHRKAMDLRAPRPPFQYTRPFQLVLKFNA